MRKLQWILHGEKDSLNALGEMKLVLLTLSEPSSRRRDWNLRITCNNQIPSSCSSLWKIPVLTIYFHLLWQPILSLWAASLLMGHGTLPQGISGPASY